MGLYIKIQPVDNRRKEEFVMLTLLFGICLLAFFGNMIVFAIKMAWGLGKVFFTVVFFPLILICMVVGGLIKLAFPLLLIGGVIGIVKNVMA